MMRTDRATQFRRQMLAAWAAILAAACDPAPVKLVERLATKDPALLGRLRPAPGTWQSEGDRLTSPGWRSASSGPFYQIGAQLPLAADGGFRVGIGRSERYTLSLWPVGARASVAAEDQGRVLYRDAYRSTDLWFLAGPERIAWLAV